MQIEAPFLTRAEMLAIDVPETADPEPDLLSVIELDQGIRRLAYEPASRHPDPAGEAGFAKLFETSRGGLSIAVFARRESPADVWAFWKLPRGYLYTFMHDETSCGADLVAGIKVVIENVNVSLTTSQLPLVALNRPLGYGDIRDPFQRDHITIHDRSSPGGFPVAELRREPGWSREGSSSYSREAYTFASATTAVDVRVEVVGHRDNREELERRAREIANSVRPV
jgi:hypothetical protein